MEREFCALWRVKVGHAKGVLYDARGERVEVHGFEAADADVSGAVIGDTDLGVFLENRGLNASFCKLERCVAANRSASNYCCIDGLVFLCHRYATMLLLYIMKGYVDVLSLAKSRVIPATYSPLVQYSIRKVIRVL